MNLLLVSIDLSLLDFIWVESYSMYSKDMSLSKLREMVKDREAWHAAVRGVTKSWTRLSDWTAYSMWSFILWVPFFTWHVFKVHPCCSMYHYFFFYSQLIFHCLDLPRFYSSAAEHLDCFCSSAIMNSITFMHKFLCDHTFSFLLDTYLGIR